MGSRGQSGRDKDARDIVGQYELESIGENKAKILSFYRDLDKTDEREIARKFQEEGQQLAEDLSESMVYRNDDARKEFNDMRRAIGSTVYTISDKDRSNIEDFGKYIRSSDNFVTIGKRGLPIDSAYVELNHQFPSLFPSSVRNPADQLLHINQVLGRLKRARVVEASQEDKESATPYIYDDLARAYNEIRRRQGKKIIDFGQYVKRRGGGGGRYDFDDEDELPFF